MGKRRAKDGEDDKDDCGCGTLFRYGCNCLGFIGCGLILLAVYILLGGYCPDLPARYSVAISAVSGLDPATDPRDGRALDPAFNLTIRVDATGRKNDGACLDESTSVHVTYLRVPLAAGRAINSTCAEAGGQRDVEVVARGRGVAVPGFLLDSLVEDLRRGVAAFEVTLMSPRNGGWDVTTCRGKVGDAATLEVPCPYWSWVKAGLPVPQQPAGSSGGGLEGRSRKVAHDVPDEDSGLSPAGTLASI